ncbi:MAG: gliding motility-associated C-terminal domain-containing protein [Bacteroidetes bacterium]|nr:gliding motility-associated C-terminal domain-containing protein [Bacteroidota bacterium]
MNVRAQIDTSFWFVAPDISSGLGDRPVYLYFNTYAQGAVVKVSQPANGSFTQITRTIPANSIDSVDLTSFIASIENNTPNTVLNNGLYISSSQKISALYSIRSATNKEYYSLKGPKALGVDFYIPMQEFWNQTPATSPKSFSSFDIVASKNNTTVLITPKTNIIGHLANVTYSVLLQQGQTYSCQDTTRTAITSLGGSIVSSNNPIAVTIQSSGLNEAGCLSSVGDQITTSAYIGTDYIVNKGTASTEKIFILATQNNTQITINDGSVTTHVSNFGETFVYTASQPITYVKTNKPVYTLHVSGYGCRLSGAQLPTFFCAGTFTTAFTRTSSDPLTLNLFTRTGFEGNFALNGNASLIPASAFTVVPGSGGNIKSASIVVSSSIAVGSHNVVTNSGDVFGMGILNGSNANGSAYAYVSEFVSYPSINAGSNATICANGNLNLNAQIGGGNIAGTWSTNGYGAFNGGFTALSNTYTPSQLDTTLKPVKLFLTSNGPCPSLKDTLLLYVKQSPLVNASVDQIVCGNNNVVSLNGSVTGGSTSGIWTSLGSGSFVPTNTVLTGSYHPSSADTVAGTVKLVLTSTANGICALARDTMKITITKPPTAEAGVATMSVCANNPTLSVTGTIGGSSSTGKWTTSGTGSFNPSNIQLSTNYFPSTADINAGQIKLYLSSTNNGNCTQARDSIIVVFTGSPSVNAGTDKYICKNNIATVLSGVISGPTTTGLWTGGTGTFTPGNAVLNATYTPSASELSAGSVNLTLSSTNNANCNQVSDNVLIIFTNPPTVYAGADVSSCHNNSSTLLSGVISGTTTTGIWSGGTGTFTPNNSALNATYIPTAAELTAGTVTLTLTSTNNSNCNQVSDNVSINFTAPPVVNAGIDLSYCKNNAATVLSGTVTGASTTGIWSGGSGSFNPSNSVLNATYTPNASELSAGSVTLTLTSSNNGNCNQVTDNVVILYTSSPSVNAGANLSVCKNNPTAVLSATVNGATTTGIWSGGTGTFTPNNTDLNASYSPSAAELAAGSVNLVLTSSNNGNCNQVSDNVLIAYTIPPSVNAGTDLSICKNNATTILSGIVSGPTTTGIWSCGTGTFTPGNAVLNATYTPSASELATGIVSLTLTSSNNGNCNQVIDTVKIIYTNSPTVNAGLDISSCKNNAYAALSGNVSGPTTTGVWSGGSGSFNPGNSALTSTYTPNASEINAGFVNLVLSSTNNGNCYQSSDTVHITFTNSPLANAGVDLYSCKNNAAVVLAGGVSGPTTTGIWTGGSGTFNPGNSVLNATYTPSASEIAVGYVNLTLTSTNNGNCNAVSDLVKLNFVPKPFANFNFNNVCLNNSTSFSDFSLAGIGNLSTWEWNFGDNTTSNLQNPTHTYTASGAFVTQLVVSNSYNCYDTIRQSPFIYKLPVADFGTNRVCNGNLLNINFSDSSTVAAPETINQWLWDFSLPGGVQSNQQNPSLLFPGSGVYNIRLIVTSNHNCKDTVEKQINLTPRPTAGFAYAISPGINVGTTVNFVDTSSYASSWNWSFGDGNTGSVLQNPSTIYFNNGVFVVTQIVTDAYGCTDTARVAIRINNVTNEISTLIPNAISPNGDGKNDVWKLDFLNILYPNASVEIYNRWGENVYSAEGGYSNPWDGTYKGQKLPVGTYYYVLNLNDPNIPEPFKGGILLVR